MRYSQKSILRKLPWFPIIVYNRTMQKSIITRYFEEFAEAMEKIYMIRQADKQDIPRIAEIIVFGKRVAYRPIFENDYGSFNELQVVNFYEEYNNNPDRLDGMLLYDDGIVKGVIKGHPIDGKTIEITDFYVEPFFVGQGIGTLLIEHLIQQVRKKGRIK